MYWVCRVQWVNVEHRSSMISSVGKCCLSECTVKALLRLDDVTSQSLECRVQQKCVSTLRRKRSGTQWKTNAVFSEITYRKHFMQIWNLSTSVIQLTCYMNFACTCLHRICDYILPTMTAPLRWFRQKDICIHGTALLCKTLSWSTDDVDVSSIVSFCFYLHVEQKYPSWPVT